MVKSLGKDWKKWGIYDIIMLSWHDIALNIGLVFRFLGVWATFINGFIFPFAMMSLILLDVVAITGLSTDGINFLPFFFYHPII